MKTITIHLEDQEHNDLQQRKGDLTWKEYLMRIEDVTQKPSKKLFRNTEL